MANKKLQHKLAEEFGKSKDVHFEKFEIQVLIDIYFEFTKTSNKKMDRTKFRDILHHHFDMTDDIIMDRIFKTFDRDNDGIVSLQEWIRGLSAFLRSTGDEQITFCFEVYDLNGDGAIVREEMYQLLKNSLIRQNINEEDTEDSVKDLVEMTIKKLDLDHDAKVTPAEFKVAVVGAPLLMQILGTCLPTDKTRLLFEEFIAAKRVKT